MNTTHAKRIGTPEATVNIRTVDNGFKKPCNCNSGKKFKACCYDKPTKGWGWVAIAENTMTMMSMTYADVKPEFAGAHVIEVYPTYRYGQGYLDEYQRHQGTTHALILVRMPVADLVTHARHQFPVGTRALLVIPPEIAENPDGDIIDVLTEVVHAPD